MNFNPKYKIGQEVKDIITGFSGIVMCYSCYFSGCIHYGVAGRQTPNGKIEGWEYFDESRIELVNKENIFEDRIEKPHSGPGNNPPCIG